MAWRNGRVSGGLVTLLAAGAALTACGGGHPAAASSSVSMPSTSTTVPASATSTVGATPGRRSASSAEAFAERVNLSASDLPAGWTTFGGSTMQGAPDQALQACATSFGARSVRVVASPTFSSPLGAQSGGSAASPPGELLSVVAFPQPPSSARKLAAAFATSTGLHCLESTLAGIGSRTGGRVRFSDFSVSPSRTSVGGASVSEVALTYDEAVSAGTFSEHVPVHQQIALFAKGGALVELTGIDLPASDAALFRTILARLVSRA